MRYIWWFVILPLCMLWILPMTGLQQTGGSVWVFAGFTVLWTSVFAFAELMYDWGTNIGRRLGHTRMVALRERLKPDVLPPARAGLAIMAFISAVFAVLKLIAR